MNFTKPYIIAEIGVNYYDIAEKYNLSLFDAIKLMIKDAKIGGADAVKFQTYKASTLASKNSPSYWDLSKEKTTNQYDLFTKFDKLKYSDYEQIFQMCKEIGIEFLSTPFDEEAVDFLDTMVTKFKIASADVTNLPLINAIISKKKPIILSTGASTLNEIDFILNKIGKSVHVSLLHCVLSYPTPYEDANLNRIPILKEKFPDCAIGYSDHTIPDTEMLTVTTAVLLGAEIIEKHYTLDKTIPGNDHYHAMNKDDLIKFKNNLLLLEKLFLKNEPNYLECEKVSRKNARRSVYAKREIAKNKILTLEDLICKRPAFGIAPTEIDLIVGKKSIVTIDEDELITFDKIQ